MEYFEEINNLKYLFCTEITEPFENELSISIQEASILRDSEDVIIGNVNIGPAKKIVTDGMLNYYNIYFNTYAAYSVLNESFTILQKHEERIGRLLCVYSKSDYLDYIRNHTIVEHVLDKQLKYYAINCLMHVIYIASMSDPVITKINN